MSHTISASCYIKSNASVEDFAVKELSQLSGAGLFVLGADPVHVLDKNFENSLESVPKYKKMALCFSKVAYSINPPLAILVFIVRLKILQYRIGDDFHVLVEDDYQDYGDLKSISHGKVLVMLMSAILQTPIWLAFWLYSRFK